MKVKWKQKKVIVYCSVYSFTTLDCTYWSLPKPETSFIAIYFTSSHVSGLCSELLYEYT